MECYCYLRNVHDKMVDGKTAFEKRFGRKVDGPSILFGTLVEHYHERQVKDQSVWTKNAERNLLRLWATRGR